MSKLHATFLGLLCAGATSALAADGAAPGPAIGTVSSFGYTGFLIGPTAIGLIAQAASVPFALWLLPLFTAVGGALGITAVRMTRAQTVEAPATVPGPLGAA